MAPGPGAEVSQSAGSTSAEGEDEAILIRAAGNSSNKDPPGPSGSRPSRGTPGPSRRALKRLTRQQKRETHAPGPERTDTHLIEPEGLFTYKKARASEGPMLIFTFLNCCVGVGLLSLPRIAAVCGYFVAAVYEIVSVSFCLWAFCRLAEANYHGNFRTAHELAERLYGKAWGWAVDLSIMCCLMPIPYVSVTADYLREGIAELAGLAVLKEPLWVNVFKAGASLFVIFPLTLLRSISAFNTISSFAVIFVLLALVALLIRFGQWNATGFVNGLAHPAPPIPLTPIGHYWPDIISYFPVFLALLSVHASVTPIQHELGGTPKQRLKSVKVALLVAIPLVSVIYVLAAVVGSLMFNVECPEPSEGTEPGECIQLDSNVLLSFSNDTFMCVVKLLYSVVVIASVPVLVYPIRGNIMSWFKLDVNTKKGYLWYVFIGFLIMLLSTVLSIAIPGIDQVISLISSIGGVILYMLFLSFTVYKLPLLRQNSVGDSIERAIHAAEEEGKRAAEREQKREYARKQSTMVSLTLREEAEKRPAGFARSPEEELDYIPSDSVPDTMNLIDLRLSSTRAAKRPVGGNLARDGPLCSEDSAFSSGSSLNYAMTGQSIIPDDGGAVSDDLMRPGILEYTKQAGLARQLIGSPINLSNPQKSRAETGVRSSSLHSRRAKVFPGRRRHSDPAEPPWVSASSSSDSGSPRLGDSANSDEETKFDLQIDEKGTCSIKFAHAQPEYFREPFKPAAWRRGLFYGSAALMVGVSILALVCNVIIMFK